MIESIKDYIKECPCLDELANININYLEDIPNSFSIEEEPREDIVITKQYLDGCIEKEFHFILACMFTYNASLETNIQNSGFLEKFEEWIEDNNMNDIMPRLRSGLNPVSIMITKNGYLSIVSGTSDMAKYQIHLKLIYEKEKV